MQLLFRKMQLKSRMIFHKNAMEAMVYQKENALEEQDHFPRLLFTHIWCEQFFIRKSIKSSIFFL